MFRRCLPTYWPDEPQHEHHPDEDQYFAEMTERDYGPRTHCPRCGKPLEASLLCPYCGDEEQEEAA